MTAQLPLPAGVHFFAGQTRIPERTAPGTKNKSWKIGADTGTMVSEDYLVPFKLTGTLNRVVMRLGEGKLTRE